MSNIDRTWREEDPLQDRPGPAANKQQNWTLRDYCSKMMHISQMDVEYTFAQIFYSLISPSKLYLLTKWRKRKIRPYFPFRDKKLLGAR